MAKLVSPRPIIVGVAESPSKVFFTGKCRRRSSLSLFFLLTHTCRKGWPKERREKVDYDDAKVRMSSLHMGTSRSFWTGLSLAFGRTILRANGHKNVVRKALTVSKEKRERVLHIRDCVLTKASPFVHLLPSRITKKRQETLHYFFPLLVDFLRHT